MILVSLKSIPHAEQSAYAHVLLGECLRYWGIEYEKGVTPMVYNDMGKPALAEFPGVHFNLSHAEGVTACIVTNCECGIDCERIRPYKAGVIKRAFSDKEKAFIAEVSEEEKSRLFFRIWTLKEAYVKAIGRGISYPLNRLSFTIGEKGISANVEGWKFTQHIIGDAVIAVCEKE